MLRHDFGDTVVVALGGSVVYPDQIDVPFIRAFCSFARSVVKTKRKLVIVVGGGRLARFFQDAAGKIAPVVNEDKDWIGIHATRLNAHLLRTVFKDIADPVVIDERHKVAKLSYPITIASGWRPGWSTDYVAVALAADLGVRDVVVAGKPSHVFDKDPHRYRGAKSIERISWQAYRKLIPSRWTPGLGAPVDPVATRLAARNGISAIIVNGRDLKNFRKLITGKEFVGSIIS